MTFLISTSEDKTIKIWSVITGECLKTLVGHGRVVNDADFHPTFKMYSKDVSILSCSGDGTLRLWNSSDEDAVCTVYGHNQAVYRCSFAPDGKTFISCSEDKTVRVWSFPEGYNVFVYKGHNSPVVSVRYSSSGRYFVSGSDYGERRILLWDAKLPHFHDPLPFAHVIFWTPEGLIRKFLIKKGVPKTMFWLAQSQLGLITNEDDLEIWTGELSDDEMMEDDEEEEKDGSSDEEEQTKKKTVDSYNIDDKVELHGVLLEITSLSPSGEKLVATEYNPGGSLILKLSVSVLSFFLLFFNVLIHILRRLYFSPIES
jgi:WD40 repeat protein